jgi:hypothetical protein
VASHESTLKPLKQREAERNGKYCSIRS